MSQLAKLFKPQYQFYCGLKHQWVRSAIDNTYRKLDDRVARPDEMLEGAVHAYKYFSTKMISKFSHGSESGGEIKTVKTPLSVSL